MNKFKINFRLRNLDNIVPWGQATDLSLHWFGLTDGLLWIDIGEQTIYEYNDEANEYFGIDEKYNDFGIDKRYNDYQIARFLEDFFGIFKYVSESIPEELYYNLNKFDGQMIRWKETHMEDDDEAFDLFYFNEYCELGSWYWNRIFDSLHLTGGPDIGLFRCGDRIKILWESTFKLENGNSIWTAPKGCCEILYEEFILSVSDFLDSFFYEMDKQVEYAINKDWRNISLDKERLLAENNERKSAFYKELMFLKNTNENTDWSKILMLYSKMSLK